MHRTHLSLTAWFLAMYLCATDKRGISASQLSRLLDVCYETAWHLFGEIRTAMGQRGANYVLSGLVEMNDCYLGGPCSGGRRGRGTDKATVVVALSKTNQGIPLIAHMQVVKDLKTETLQEFLNQHLAEGTVIQCDGYSSYCGLTGVNCNRKAFDAANGDLKWLQQVNQQSQGPHLGLLPWPSFQALALSQRILLTFQTQTCYQPAISQARSRCCFILCPADLSRYAPLQV